MGLGGRATFQGRGRRNDAETSVRTNETLEEKGKSEAAGRHTGRVKDLMSGWVLFPRALR